jgi:hypothetical protein
MSSGRTVSVGRPSPLVRTPSQGGPSVHPMGSNRTRSIHLGLVSDAAMDTTWLLHVSLPTSTVSTMSNSGNKTQGSSMGKVIIPRPRDGG